MSELKPCPFCGEPENIELIIDPANNGSVCCHSCYVVGPTVKLDTIKAIKLWNTRTEVKADD